MDYSQGYVIMSSQWTIDLTWYTSQGAPTLTYIKFVNQLFFKSALMHPQIYNKSLYSNLKQSLIFKIIQGKTNPDSDLREESLDGRLLAFNPLIK